MGMDLTGLGSVFDFGSKIIDKIWPDPAQRDAAKLELFKAQQAGEFKDLDQAFELAKAQIGVNAIEASSTRLFVAGWRPFVGWSCGGGLCLQFIIAPLATWGATLAGHPITFPVLDSNLLLTCLGGLLGLGSLRTVEKIKGAA